MAKFHVTHSKRLCAKFRRVSERVRLERWWVSVPSDLDSLDFGAYVLDFLVCELHIDGINVFLEILDLLGSSKKLLAHHS